VNIGKRIQQYRKKNGLTLEELASRSELTKGFLSQVERDLTSPSIATLSDIVEALGISLSEFFNDTQAREKFVFGPDDHFEDDQGGVRVHWIVPNAQKNDMEPILIELDPDQTSSVIDPHSGEEFGYVLQGRVSLIIDGKKHILKKGNTFYLKGTYAHYLRNDSTSEASVLWVCTPPIF
jgi:transcriptional regulator with XRE-family HTH domain